MNFDQPLDLRPGAALPPEIEVVDTHTEGEPTRVVIGGWPQPEGADMATRRDWMERNQDHLRTAVVCEPRGHEAMVGALLTPAVNPDSQAGIVFFNNVGYLGMCGHGLIGVVRALADSGRLTEGEHNFDTPVGPVRAKLEVDGRISFRNVPGRCLKLQIEVDVPEIGLILGDVAWGGNGFLITSPGSIPLTVGNLDELLNYSRAIARVVQRADFLPSIGVSDFDQPIDHVELSGLDSDGIFPGEPCDARSFVLCPGDEWDRSPCGTGTSAKMAVLHQRRQLAVGHRFRNRSITGGVFSGWLEEDQGTIYPHIEGRAWVVSRARLRFEGGDPLATGLSLRPGA